MKLAKRTIALSVLSFVVLFGGISVYSLATTSENTDVTEVQQQVQPRYTSATKEELLKLVNEERAKVGVAPLVIDDRLNQSAQRKADDMVKHGYFDHLSPADNRQGYTYVLDVAPECKIAGENMLHQNDIDPAYRTAKTAVGGWMLSESHKNAILDSSYTFTGFGIANNFIVEHFCVK